MNALTSIRIYRSSNKSEALKLWLNRKYIQRLYLLAIAIEINIDEIKNGKKLKK